MLIKHETKSTQDIVFTWFDEGDLHPQEGGEYYLNKVLKQRLRVQLNRDLTYSLRI